MTDSLDRLFLLIAAYCQIGTTPKAFMRFYSDTSNWVFRETRSRSLWDYLCIRFSRRLFEVTAGRMVGRLYESRRVELALRRASLERLATLSPTELPAYFREIEGQFLHEYRETLPVEISDAFVAEQFLRMRTQWIREMALRVVPTLFVVAALAFAGASMFTMSGGTGESLRNTLSMLKGVLGLAP